MHMGYEDNILYGIQGYVMILGIYMRDSDAKWDMGIHEIQGYMHGIQGYGYRGMLGILTVIYMGYGIHCSREG